MSFHDATKALHDVKKALLGFLPFWGAASRAKRPDPDTMDETEYLLSSPANAERLRASIREFDTFWDAVYKDAIRKHEAKKAQSGE